MGFPVTESYRKCNEKSQVKEVIPILEYIMARMQIKVFKLYYKRFSAICYLATTI